MGRGSCAACLDCRQAYDLGYGPYTTWMDRWDTLAEFDAAAATEQWQHAAGLTKNQACRAFLVLHEGHRIARWFEDYAGVESRDGRELVTENCWWDEGPRVIADVTGFEWFVGDTGQLLPVGAAANGPEANDRSHDPDQGTGT